MPLVVRKKLQKLDFWDGVLVGIFITILGLASIGVIW